MKIRKGFVSNSSSSSFIIALKEKPKSSKDLQNILFGEKDYFFIDDPNCPAFINHFSLTSKDAARIIFKDLKKPASLKEIKEELMWGTLYSKDIPKNIRYPKCPRYEENEKLREKKEKEYDKKVNSCIEKVLKHFLQKTKNLKYFIVEYSDNEGALEAVLEHEGTFNKIPHIQVSKH